MTLTDGLSVLLVFLIGFAAHRASLCTVRAVMQWLDDHKASVLISFIKAAAWSCLLAGVFVLFGLPIKGVPVTHGVWWLGILGGFLFGMGAAINGGCSLSTVQQLADGDSSMLLTLLAFVSGVAGTMTLENLWLPQMVQPQALWWQQLTLWQHVTLVTVLTLWAVRELVMQWQSRDQSLSVLQRFVAPRYRLSFGALLLGVASGLLFLLEGTWTYTNYLREQTKSWFFDGISTGWVRGILVLTLFVGMLASSFHRGSFSWRWPNMNNWQRRVLGGFLMGSGGALVPGGNDTLILVLIPTLSLQALTSYVALLAGIGSVLMIMRSVRSVRT